MIQPATVESQLARGQHLAEIWCATCRHEATVPIDDMPRELPIPDICLGYRCSKCGSKRLMSRMSIAEFYEQMERRTGLSYGNR